MAAINHDKSKPEVTPQTQAMIEQQRTREIERQMPPNDDQRQNRADVVRREDVGRDKEMNRDEAEEDAQPGTESEDRSSRQQDIIGSVQNIPSTGDKLQLRRDDDGVIRFGFQNVNSIEKPRQYTLQPEIVVIGELGINICGYAETNCPWIPRRKHIFDEHMRCEFNNQVTTCYASLPAPHGTTYQPGGVLQTINGGAVGRISESGADKYGRYVWHSIRGSRDEGIVVITAYRVSQNTLAECGPNTAYSHQHTAMLRDGVAKPNPRQQILTDLATLIQEKRSEGLRPILMMDANGTPSTDDKFREFLQDTLLEDPYYDRFHDMPRTYLRGSRRLDYILMDMGLVPAIKSMGYLGTHEAVHSDHSMAWVDFDEKQLFRGKINRPPEYKNRQFTLNQEDKKASFMKDIRDRVEKGKIPYKVTGLVAAFHERGPTSELIDVYNKLDTEYTDMIRAALKKTARRRYGYARSPELTHAGQELNFHKAILDCRRRKAPPSEGLKKLAKLLGHDLKDFTSISLNSQRKQVRRKRKELWEIQKKCELKRLGWLQVRSKERGEEAMSDKEWEKKMKDMMSTTTAAATNRKLSILTKGMRSGLDRIEIPQDEWVYSHNLRELYHYTDGVFETHAEIEKNPRPRLHERLFYSHHSLKVPDPKAVPVKVRKLEDGRIQITEVITNSPFRWKTITSQKDIESTILERNKRHLQQVAREGGPSTQPPIQPLTEMDGRMAEAAILGKYVPKHLESDEPMEVNDTLAEWLSQLKQTPKERAMKRTVGSIPPEALQQAFQRAKERTASHGDLHYTVWKTLVAEDDFAAWIAIMISIPFMHGFAPERWKSMTDVMLEKKKGNRQINQLRIIGLLEADFNTALKYFARELSHKMEDAGELSEEQWGSRKNRNSVDAAMIKLLTFEMARAKRSTIGVLYYDCTACYDRMHPALSNAEMRKRNFDEGILKARAEAMRYMRRHVRTGLAISQDTYSEEQGDHPIAGEIQGKADNPALFTACSSGMLKVHAKLAPGLEMHSCTRERAMRRNNVSYVDDNDGNVSADFQSDRPLDEVIAKMKLSSKIWNEVVTYTGQSLAYHKCKWQVLAWQAVRGELKPIMAIDDVILLEDHKGAMSIIQFLPPDQPNKGLGYHICPDGNQKQEYDVVMAKLRRISSVASTAYLTDSEARQLLYQRLMPTMDYVLNLTSFDENKCRRMDTVIRQNFFPSMRFNRNSADAVMRGPMEQGGMEFPDIYSRQTELQTMNVIKHLRHGDVVANDFLATLDMIQLQSGLVEPIFEYKGQLPYLEIGFIKSLRNRLAEIDASIWIEDAWTPKLQREGDRSIMGEFIKMGYKATKLRHLNAVRIYMRVITIADLAMADGKEIGHTSLQGTYQAGSDIEWPETTEPRKEWVTLFRKSIRETFCSMFTDTRHPIKDSMRLDRPLGKWKQVPRHVWYDSYRGKDAVYRRSFDTDGKPIVQKLTETHPQSGFYRYEKNVEKVPIESYPMAMTQIGEEFWTRRPYRMEPEDEPDPKPPGYVVADTHHLGREPCPVKTGSDASVHLAEECAAAAWIIPTTDEEFVKACFLMTNMRSVNSYRAELEGVYRALLHMNYLDMKPGVGKVTQWFDNESGVYTSNRPLKKATDTIGPEGDILMAIQHLKEKLPYKVVSRHVRGHQDTRKNTVEANTGSDTDDTQCDSDSDSCIVSSKKCERDHGGLTDDAKINIARDELAGEVTAGALADPGGLPPPEELLQMPYEGSKAVLRIGEEWITAREKRHLYNARREPIIRKHIMRRHQWDEEQYQKVYWKQIGQVRRGQKLHAQRFTCKLMHGILPVNHVRQHVTQMAQCPACMCEDETVAHIFKCPNQQMITKRDEIIAALRKKGLRTMSRPIRSLVADLVELYAKGDEMTLKRAPKHREVRAALTAQSTLGWEYFFRGYLVKEWVEALEVTHQRDAHQQFGQLLQVVWFDIAEPLWTERNRIAHGPDSNMERIESAMLAMKLVWYNEHREELLPYYQQQLAKRDLNDILRMKTSTRRTWLYHLKIATEEWEKRKYSRKENQRVITEYLPMTSVRQRKSRKKEIERQAHAYAAKRVLRQEDGQRRIDRIFKAVEKSCEVSEAN